MVFTKLVAALAQAAKVLDLVQRKLKLIIYDESRPALPMHLS